MASIGRDPSGRRRILFVDQDGRRKTIRLGRCSEKQALSFKVKLEALIAGRFSSIDEETARWVGALPDDMHGKLAAVGLVPARTNLRLGEFLDQYIEGRVDIKPQTAVVLGHTRRNLIDHFGADKPLRQITEVDADGFRASLRSQGLSEATVRRRTGIAKQFFKAALRRKLVCANPFIDLPSAVGGNVERQRFIRRADTEKILDACPDPQWRLIVALARYGGLRTPSETLRLRWIDVDWDRGRVTIHSPKTEHHAGHESRQIPLFPELREPLMEVFEQAEPGGESVITRYRLGNMNLRTQFGRILRKAGLQPWPRLFQNLRSSRQTELCEQWPEHVVCAWMGNTRPVAREHYLQVRDDDFTRAAQNPAQSAAVRGCNTRERPLADKPEKGDFLCVTAGYDPLQDNPLGPVGFEPTTKGL
jgi:integrase